jgi:hypothetical protein
MGKKGKKNKIMCRFIYKKMHLSFLGRAKMNQSWV